MNIQLNTKSFDRSETPDTHRNSEFRSRESAQRKPSGHRSRATLVAAISLMTLGSLWFSAPAAFAADEVCSSCGPDVRVNGEFVHRKDNASVTIQGAPADNAAAFREEINGKNFNITIAHLPAGRYTISIGEVETLASAAGERLARTRHASRSTLRTTYAGDSLSSGGGCSASRNTASWGSSSEQDGRSGSSASSSSSPASCCCSGIATRAISSTSWSVSQPSRRSRS